MNSTRFFRLRCVSLTSQTMLATMTLVAAACGNDVIVPGYDLVQFFEAKAPTVDRIVPSIVQPAGGQTVKIEGQNIREGAKAFLGNLPCEIQKLDETFVECLAPATNPGIVDVRIVNQDQKTGVLEKSLTISDVPVVAQVSPKAGPLFGGKTLTLSGQNFTEGGLVFVGAAACSDVRFLSKEVVTCVLPTSENIGDVIVSFTNNLKVKCES